MYKFKEKYIAFIDILGFKSLIRTAECGEVSVLEIIELLKDFENNEYAEILSKHGPIICPPSGNKVDLDFVITQCSDSVLATCDISPLGLVHIIDYSKQVVFKMMKHGLMCRGYIAKGMIYHNGSIFFGTGFHDAYLREATVDSFKKFEEERSTPYVKIDENVLEDLDQCPNKCVQKMASRVVKRVDTEAVVSPWKIFNLLMSSTGNRSEFMENIENIKNNIERLRSRVQNYIDTTRISVMDKFIYYNDELDNILKDCEKAIETNMIFSRPVPARRIEYSKGGISIVGTDKDCEDKGEL